MGSATIVHEADMTDQRRNSPSGRARYRPRRVGMHLPVNAYHVNESGCERRSRRSNEGFCTHLGGDTVAPTCHPCHRG